MLRPSTFLVFAFPVSLAAQAAVSIADGNARFDYSSYPPFTNSTLGYVNFAATGTDHCYQSWWYYAVQGDTAGSAFNSANGQLTATTSADNRTAFLDWANVDGRGFAAALRNTVYSTGATSGVAAQTMTITNNTAAPLVLHVYKYVDMDVSGSPGDRATQEPGWPAGNHMVQDTGGAQTWVMASAFSNYEVQPYQSLRTNILTGFGGAPYVPGNAGLPFGPGDYTGCFHWLATIAPSTAQSFHALLAIGQPPVSQRLASAETYCVGKQGTNGMPTWALNPPFLGASAELRIENGFTGSPPVVFLGLSQVNLPFPPFGVVCTMPVTQIPMPPFDATRVSSLLVPIPNQRSLGGATIDLQGLFLDPGASASLAHTDGLAWTFGSFRN